MKTSNKILLGAVVSIMLILTAIHIALYAKYKKGDFYTMAQLHEERFEKHYPKGVTKVSITGMGNVDIYPSDTLRLEIEKNGKKSEIAFEQVGDSLILKGATAVKLPDGNIASPRSFFSTILYLPANTKVTIGESDVRFKGAADTSHAYSYNIAANNANLVIGQWDDDTHLKSYFNQLLIQANGGKLRLLQKATFKEVAVSLNKAEMTDEGFTADTFNLAADDQSSIQLKGNNLKKVIPVNKP
jgi:hypothetical protein